MVVARKADCPVSLLATAGLDTIAVRVPAHGIARALLLGFGGPLVAPSANRSGRVSPTEAAHVAEDFADEDLLILDGGPTAVGLESTVIDVTGATPSLLRPGAIARADLERLLGTLAAPEGDTAPASPGQLASHYAPSLPVRLNVRTPRPDEALIAFGPEVPEGALRVLNLSSAGDLLEAAANLFRLMRAGRRPAGARHRRHADPRNRSWRSHQRPARAGRGAAPIDPPILGAYFVGHDTPVRQNPVPLGSRCRCAQRDPRSSRDGRAV